MLVAIALVLLLVLIALGLSVAAALGVLGLLLDQVFSTMPLHRALGELAWLTGTNFLLTAIPLFILMGEILLRSGIADQMYGAMVRWLSWLPGGLMHSNIGASALFAATSGSSVATAATVGTVALPQARRQRYSEPLFLGTLAAGGTLGILIPPSINLIIYGVLTDTSVPRLFMAGLLPGVVLAGLFMLTVLIACLMRPRWGGAEVDTTWAERFRSLRYLLPPIGLFLVVVGSIYVGLATPTESAALGVVAALVLSALRGRLDWPMLRQCFENALRTTAMVVLIILAAKFLNFVLAATGVTTAITAYVSGLGLSPFGTLLAVIVFYFILGFFMETLSMMITTVPVVAAIVIGAGYDPVWFGILLMILLETALITPPVGLNLYVVQSVRRGGPFNDVIVGTAPFVLTMLAFIGLLIAFPGIALWLPGILG